MCSKKLSGLELSLTIGCQLDCKYCPQQLLLGRYFEENKLRVSKLSYENFKIALNQVQEGSTISFCGMSEPFHNERCADMIVYAYENGYKISLLTTLVGMSRSDFDKIKDINFDSFVLHIPDSEKNSKFVITKEYLEIFKLVNQYISIDYYSCHGTPHRDVENIIDKEKYAGIELANRAGNLDLEEAIAVAPRKGGIACYHGSEAQIGGWEPVMLPDGTLVLCCMDYGMKHILGNLLTDTWENIIQGEEYQLVKKGWLDDSIDLLCRSCHHSCEIKNLPAMKISKLISEQRILYKEKESVKKNDSIISKIADAENVCVYGLGKLFRDHFFQEYWHEGLGVNILSDNNANLQGQKLGGIECVKPDALSTYENLIVIIFVKNSGEIKKQFEAMGISNYTTIDEIISEYNGMTQYETRPLSL